MDIHEVETEIRKIENDRTTWGNCEKLAVLYTVKDHYTEQRVPQYSFAAAAEPEKVGKYGDSEFLRAVEGRDPSKVWALVNELVESEMVLNPRVYASLMRRLREI